MKPWLKCSLRVGQLAIPVGLASTSRKNQPVFRTLHRECLSPVELRAWCDPHDRPVPPEEAVKALEVAAGQYVPLEQEDLDALAPIDTREIRVTTVVGTEHVNTTVVEGSYWLTPSEAPVGRRPYVLLERVLNDADLVALCKAVVKGAEWACAVRAHQGALVLDRLVLQDDRVSADPIHEQLQGVEILEQELQLGRELLLSMFQRKGPRTGELASEHRDRVRHMLDIKLAGGTISQPAAEPAAPMQLPVADLTDTLRSSIRDLRRRPKAKPNRRARQPAG